MEDGCRHSMNISRGSININSNSNSSSNNNKRMLSASALSNNIGAHLLKQGQIEEATEYFNKAIANSHCESKRAGLGWFLRKLERQSLNEIEHPKEVCMNAHRRASLTLTCSRKGSIAAALLTHEPVCDEHTPLGFEYFGEPLSVDTSMTESDGSNDQQSLDRITLSTAMMNLASLLYQHVQTKDEWKRILEILSKAAPKSSFLRAVQSNNVGVILFQLGNTKEAFQHLEQANAMVDEFRIQNVQSLQHSNGGHHANDNDNNNDEEPINIRYAYIHLTVLLNYARLCVRLNDTAKASMCCDEFATVFENVAHTYQNNLIHNHRHSALLARIRWISSVAKLYIMGMVHQRTGNLTSAFTCYRDFSQKARHTLGHSHLHVASCLFLKGMVLFDQRKLHHAQIAQVASLKIHESHPSSDPHEMARVMYSVGRTLHDREEYNDAQRMYQRTLQLQTRLNGVTVDVVTTLCNIARVHHICGELPLCLSVNQTIVQHAKTLSQGKKHPFVADRLVVLGNVFCEMGRMDEAMETFADAARAGGNNIRSSPYDVDSHCAASLAKVGLQHPGAAKA